MERRKEGWEGLLEGSWEERMNEDGVWESREMRVVSWAQPHVEVSWKEGIPGILPQGHHCLSEATLL